MNRRILKRIFGFGFGIVLCMLSAAPASAQNAAVKTNLLHWGTLTPNGSMEFGMGKKTSLDLYGAYNWFSENSSKTRVWKHYLVQPEFRWWFCERFNGSFIGVHAHGGEFNLSGFGPFHAIKNNRYEGWFIGGGVSYGHQWILSNRWALELEIGVGYAHVNYDKFGCGECKPKIKSGHYNYFGPTKAQVAFSFFLW